MSDAPSKYDGKVPFARIVGAVICKDPTTNPYYVASAAEIGSSPIFHALPSAINGLCKALEIGEDTVVSAFQSEYSDIGWLVAFDALSEADLHKIFMADLAVNGGDSLS